MAIFSECQISSISITTAQSQELEQFLQISIVGEKFQHLQDIFTFGVLYLLFSLASVLRDDKTSHFAKKFTDPMVPEPPRTYLGGLWRVDL